MKQIKPKVIGYKQVGYDGRPFNGLVVRSSEGMVRACESQFIQTGIKSKFRPVYAKED